MPLQSNSQPSGQSSLKCDFYKQKHSFKFAKISDDTMKYYHVVAALNQETSGRILDALTAPPPDNKNAELKRRLLTFKKKSQQA